MSDKDTICLSSACQPGTRTASSAHTRHCSQTAAAGHVVPLGPSKATAEVQAVNHNLAQDHATHPLGDGCQMPLPCMADTLAGLHRCTWDHQDKINGTLQEMHSYIEAVWSQPKADVDKASDIRDVTPLPFVCKCSPSASGREPRAAAFPIAAYYLQSKCVRVMHRSSVQGSTCSSCHNPGIPAAVTPTAARCAHVMASSDQSSAVVTKAMLLVRFTNNKHTSSAGRSRTAHPFSRTAHPLCPGNGKGLACVRVPCSCTSVPTSGEQRRASAGGGTRLWGQLIWQRSEQPRDAAIAALMGLPPPDLQRVVRSHILPHDSSLLHANAAAGF